jgi:DNA-binding CsgD family transcriptional regulator
MRARIDRESPERPENGAESAQRSDTLRSWLVHGTHRFGLSPRRGTGRNQRARELLSAETGWSPGDRSGWRGLVTALQRHTVLNALAELHRNDRQILTMAYLQGHTNIEIARMLQVSVRTVSRRLSMALARLEDHARDAGIWIASLMLLALAFVSKPQERVMSLVRSVQWQQAAGVVAAGAAVVAVGVAVASPGAPSAQQSSFSPSGRSIAVALPAGDLSGPTAPGTTTVLKTSVPPSVNSAAPSHQSSKENTSQGANGCGPKPTDAAPPVPVGPRGHDRKDPPVTHPGPGDCKVQ